MRIEMRLVLNALLADFSKSQLHAVDMHTYCIPRYLLILSAYCIQGKNKPGCERLGITIFRAISPRMVRCRRGCKSDRCEGLCDSERKFVAPRTRKLKK